MADPARGDRRDYVDAVAGAANHPSGGPTAPALRRASPLPISRLRDGQRIETKFYGDAWTVVGTLLEEPRWSGTLPLVFEAAARTGTTSLADSGVDLDALDGDRRAWAGRHFGW